MNMSSTEKSEKEFDRPQKDFPLLNLETIINGQSYQLMCLADTGNEWLDITINIAHLKKLDPAIEVTPLDDPTFNPIGGDGNSLGVVGTVPVTLKSNGRTYQTKLGVAKHTDTPFLSKQCCVALGLINPEWPSIPSGVEDCTCEMNAPAESENDEPAKKQRRTSTSKDEDNITEVCPLVRLEMTVANNWGYGISFFADTGSNYDYMSLSVFNELGKSVTSAVLRTAETRPVIAANGNDLGMIGSFSASLKLNDRLYHTEICVIEKLPHLSILSLRGCIALGLLPVNWPYKHSTAISYLPVKKEERKTLMVVGRKFDCTFRERGCNKIGMTRREWVEHEAVCPYNKLSKVAKNCPCPICHDSVFNNKKPASPHLLRHLAYFHEIGSPIKDIVVEGKEASYTFEFSNVSHFFSEPPVTSMRFVDKTGKIVYGEYICIPQIFYPKEEDVDQNKHFCFLFCRVSGKEITPNYTVFTKNSGKELFSWSDRPLDYAQVKVILRQPPEEIPTFAHSFTESDLWKHINCFHDEEFIIEVVFEV